MFISPTATSGCQRPVKVSPIHLRRDSTQVSTACGRSPSRLGLQPTPPPPEDNLPRPGHRAGDLRVFSLTLTQPSYRGCVTMCPTRYRGEGGFLVEVYLSSGSTEREERERENREREREKRFEPPSRVPLLLRARPRWPACRWDVKPLHRKPSSQHPPLWKSWNREWRPGQLHATPRGPPGCWRHAKLRGERKRERNGERGRKSEREESW